MLEGHIQSDKSITDNIRIAATLQALEISHTLLFYDAGGWWNRELKEFYKNTAAQQFQVAILGLQLTRLGIIGVDCGCQILPDRNVGSLAQLRCFPYTTKSGSR